MIRRIPIALARWRWLRNTICDQIPHSSPRYGNPDERNALRFGTSLMIRSIEPSPARYGMNDRAPWKKNSAAPIRPTAAFRNSRSPSAVTSTSIASIEPMLRTLLAVAGSRPR